MVKKLKMIEEWASNYFNNDEPDLRETLTDVRNEAIDACIEEIREAKRRHHSLKGYVSINWLAGLDQAIEVIEDLKGRKDEGE